MSAEDESKLQQSIHHRAPCRGRHEAVRGDLTFDNIPLESVAPAIKGRNYYNQLPTTFYLPNDQVADLITVGGWLLKENPEFKRFLGEYQP